VNLVPVLNGRRASKVEEKKKEVPQKKSED
jgi:hypothetical protein